MRTMTGDEVNLAAVEMALTTQVVKEVARKLVVELSVETDMTEEEVLEQLTEKGVDINAVAADVARQMLTEKIYDKA